MVIALEQIDLLLQSLGADGRFGLKQLAKPGRPLPLDPKVLTNELLRGKLLTGVDALDFEVGLQVHQGVHMVPRLVFQTRLMGRLEQIPEAVEELHRGERAGQASVVGITVTLVGDGVVVRSAPCFFELGQRLLQLRFLKRLHRS